MLNLYNLQVKPALELCKELVFAQIFQNIPKKILSDVLMQLYNTGK